MQIDVLRRGLETLVNAANAALDGFWSPSTATLHQRLPPLVDTYGLAAAAMAADWYEATRLAAGLDDPFTALAADIGDSGTDELIDWAASVATDETAMRSLIDGGLTRRVNNFARQSVMDSALADPHADGWQRHATGTTCLFCRMLASRGTVYSADTADFAAHDGCDCVAVPAFTGTPRPVKPYRVSSRRSDETKAADNARVAAWIKANADRL